MDIQNVVNQLMGYLGNNPELIAQFVRHPYSTTATATGSDATISQSDMSQIVTQIAAQTTGQNVAGADLSGIASTLLGQNGGSVHALTSALFGGAGAPSTASASTAPSMAEIAMKSALGGIVAKGAGELIAAALSGKAKK